MSGELKHIKCRLYYKQDLQDTKIQFRYVLPSLPPK
jgi:hypothetical protein